MVVWGPCSTKVGLAHLYTSEWIRTANPLGHYSLQSVKLTTRPPLDPLFFIHSFLQPNFMHTGLWGSEYGCPINNNQLTSLLLDEILISITYLMIACDSCLLSFEGNSVVIFGLPNSVLCLTGIFQLKSWNIDREMLLNWKIKTY